MTAPGDPAPAQRSELRRRRRRRRLQGIAAALVLALLAAVAIGVWLARRTPDPTVVPQVGEQVRTQSTLLFQVVGPGGDADVSVLWGVDEADGSGVGLLIPRQVIVTVAGSGSVPFGRALRTATPDATRSALADLLGVSVDGGWGVTQRVLTALVDTVGGLEVEVQSEVVRGGTVVLAPGTQRLTGEQAVLLVNHRADGEEEAARLARQQQVLSALLSALPSDRDALLGLLRDLGERSVTSLELPTLADWLLALREASVAGEVQYDVVPAIGIDTGAGAVTAARADQDGLRQVVDRLLAQSVPPGARESGNRVLVLNGVGTPNLGERVREPLVEAGLVFVGSRNAPRFDHERTRVLVPDATPEARALAERVAAALELPASAVATADIGSVADVIVLVGADYTG